MITVDDLRKKAKRKYAAYLSSIVTGTNFFPLLIAADKKLNTNNGVTGIQEQLVPLFQQSKAVLGYGYTLHTGSVNSKYGPIEKIEDIEFQTEEDYLRFIEKNTEVLTFRNDLDLAITTFPQLENLFSLKPEILLNHHGKWESLLKVCAYFLSENRPKLYIRELPINVHTKFIERNKEIILTLLSHLSPSKLPEIGTFEEKLGLKEKHNLIRIRFLDPNLQLISGLNEIGLAETEVNLLRLNCKRVFIIENDIAALCFPPIFQAIVIFGRGFNLKTLRDIVWLKNAELYYWSDLDVHGFEMLSQIRGYHPHTVSFLMDKETLKEFRQDCGEGVESKVGIPANLTSEEKSVYLYLKEHNLRLEQEKIPQSLVTKELKKLTP